MKKQREAALRGLISFYSFHPCAFLPLPAIQIPLCRSVPVSISSDSRAYTWMAQPYTSETILFQRRRRFRLTRARAAQRDLALYSAYVDHNSGDLPRSPSRRHRAVRCAFLSIALFRAHEYVCTLALRCVGDSLRVPTYLLRGHSRPIELYTVRVLLDLRPRLRDHQSRSAFDRGRSFA